MPDGALGCVDTVARAGAGALPVTEVPSVAVAARCPRRGRRARRALRRGAPAVVCRVHDGRLLFDLRAVRDDELEDLAGAVRGARPDGVQPGAPVRDRQTRRPLTLGTAGHIDHGKTALVTRLTGKNTDRLREERERGISIELGYAELALPGGARLSVVDVPGHERFVRTMVAGATGIDLFLLVIAADDGVMPQTVEHLAIIELLGVRDGVVALTKADLVDDELLELAEADVREFLAATPYAGCEVVTVSARDGRGLDELLAALERAAGARRGAAAAAAPRGCRSTACSRSRASARWSPARCGAARSAPATRWWSSPAARAPACAACRCTTTRPRWCAPAAASA